VVNLLVEVALGGAAPLRQAAALPLRAWLLLLYLGVVCSGVGYSLWYVVIRETPVNVSALTVFMQPLAGLAMAVVFLGEQPHWGQLWGGVVILCGLAVGLRRTAPPAPPQPANALAVCRQARAGADREK
jgi:O-acetylserine/cysteine efflux transporter